MTFTIYSEEDCYFLVQALQVDGKVVDAYPTEPRENNFIRAGESRTLPDRGRFRLTAPFGEEYILVSAFREQIAIINLEVDIANVNFKTRGFNKEEYVEGALRIVADEIEPVARAMFNYTVMP